MCLLHDPSLVRVWRLMEGRLQLAGPLGVRNVMAAVSRRGQIGKCINPREGEVTLVLLSAEHYSR